MVRQEPRKIYLEKALEHRASPEQLDQLLQIVDRKGWIAAATLGSLLLVAFFWSIAGRLPITIEVPAVLSYSAGSNPERRLLAIAHLPAGDGPTIQPGMTVRITPATVERQRYGSIVGKVVMISADGFAAELAVDRSSPSGYQWTFGKGPDIRITGRTAGSVRATVGSRRPIMFIIPILRRWIGA